MKCPYCSQEHPDDDKFCLITGKPLQTQTQKCMNCGYENVQVEAKFCPRCGKPLSAKQENSFNKQFKENQSQIEFICSEDGAVIKIGDEQKQIILKKGMNVINVQEYPGLQYGYSWGDCILAQIAYIENIILSGFNTSKITNMNSLFSECRTLKSLDLSSFDTSNVEDMSRMFMGCLSLKSLDFNSFDTSNVKDMSCMFADCSSLELLDLSNFNTSKVTDMGWMFCLCTSLKTLNLSGFDVSNVHAMNSMFDGCCYSLKKVIMKGCNEETIAKITEALKKAGVDAEIITD